MVSKRKPDDYPGWISACKTSGIMELKRTYQKGCSEIRQQFKQRFSFRGVMVRSKGKLTG